jgi:F0F1-type ATP synthase membrane subunit a
MRIILKKRNQKEEQIEYYIFLLFLFCFILIKNKLFDVYTSYIKEKKFLFKVIEDKYYRLSSSLSYSR